MNDHNILIKVKDLIKTVGEVKTVITKGMGKYHGKYILSIMAQISGGDGVGYMFNTSLLDILFDKKESAERLQNKIKKIGI